MSRMKKFAIVFPLFVMLVFIQAAHADAAESAAIEIGKGGALEKIEPALEIINMILALGALALVAFTLPSLEGSLKRYWSYGAAAVGLFAALEVLGALKGFKIFQWHGLEEIIELLFIAFLLAAVYNLYNLFRNMANKK